MALKKSELYSSLWSSCDELRGGMDASQYKDYVLVLLFVKYISDRYARQPYAPIRIREGASFADMVALKGNPEIGDLINKNILRPLAEDNALSDMPDLLRVVERDAPPSVEIKHSALVLNVRPGATEAKKREVLERWYREQIRESASRLIAKWERIIGVKVQYFYVQRMKTKWGSCSESAGTIRLNSELAKKPRECLEYIVVHEMVHLLERSHNRCFMSLMEQFMPR